MSVIKPTPGRVVWYYYPHNQAEATFAAPPPGTPLAAMIARVWSDTCVNLMVIDANGVSHSKTSILLLQEGNPRPESNYCEWMPYQHAQAAKTEALQDRVKAYTDRKAAIRNSTIGFEGVVAGWTPGANEPTTY